MSTPLPQGADKVNAVRSMFDTIAPRYELVNRIISLGLDRRWRRRTLDVMQLDPSSTVLDIATGTGDFCRLLQAGGHHPVGIDLSYGMLQSARTTAPLVQADALRLPFGEASVDAVTCGFALRNLVDLGSFFDELGRVVRPGGRVGLLDAGQPTQPVVRFGHRMYFGHVVPRIGALLSDPAAYQYLPRSLAYLPEPAEMLAMLEGAGFSAVRRQTLTFGAAQLITATRR